MRQVTPSLGSREDNVEHGFVTETPYAAQLLYLTGERVNVIVAGACTARCVQRRLRTQAPLYRIKSSRSNQAIAGFCFGVPA